jgi:hypothetical protein
LILLKKYDRKGPWGKNMKKAKRKKRKKGKERKERRIGGKFEEKGLFLLDKLKKMR